MGRINKIALIIAIFIAICSIIICVKVLNTIGEFAKKDYQLHQLNNIQSAIELFNNENNGYPPSDGLDPTGQQYCGAMKLCEALIGKDLLGFHPDSVFRVDGMDAIGTSNIYLLTEDNIRSRKELFLTLNQAKPNWLLDIYGSGNTDHYNENHFVLCDVYTHEMRTGKKTGMPILYYKANTSNTEHDVNNPDNLRNIYNYKDNHALLSLGVPWKPKKQHPLFLNPNIFYEMTRNKNVTTGSEPYRRDSYILISAGFDGLYGTADDICNFDWKYRE
jgi:hypothetical protein